MPTYYVDDGGSATAPFDTWAKAATSLSALNDAVAFAAGDIVYIGHDHVCQFTHSANRTITGPTSGAPCMIISVTQGSSPPQYQASTTNQIDTTEGAYDLIFDGSFALYGICMAAGDDFFLTSTLGEAIRLDGCTLKHAAGKSIRVSVLATTRLTNCVFDLSADGTTNRDVSLFFLGGAGFFEIRDCSFVNPGYRTKRLIEESGGDAVEISGCDFSGFPNTFGAIYNTLSSKTIVSNCVSGETFVIDDSAAGTNPYSDGQVVVSNFGVADAPAFFYQKTSSGRIISSSSTYRTGGASFEGVNGSWLVIIGGAYAERFESFPARLPYIYGYLSSAGSKTFDLYITNDTADFTDAEVWLQVEYLGTANSPKWELATDQRATITTTAAAQTDDTTSTWVGTGPAFTYKQKLSVTATVAEEGQFRARVCVGVASISAARNFFIDPKVTVS